MASDQKEGAEIEAIKSSSRRFAARLLMAAVILGLILAFLLAAIISPEREKSVSMQSMERAGTILSWEIKKGSIIGIGWLENTNNFPLRVEKYRLPRRSGKTRVGNIGNIVGIKLLEPGQKISVGAVRSRYLVVYQGCEKVAVLATSLKDTTFLD